MKNNIFLQILACVCVAVSGLSGQVYQSALPPLKSAAPDGVGALSMPMLNNRPLACVFVSNKDYPDLLMLGGKNAQSIYRLPFERLTDAGVPVFGQPVEIFDAPADVLQGRCGVVQTADGVIHFITLEKGKTLAHWVCDPKNGRFERAESVKAPALPNTPGDIGMGLNPDGSVDVYFECSLPLEVPGATDSRAEDWHPYDGQGTDRRGLNRYYIYTARYPRLLAGEPQAARMVSPRKEDIYYGVGRMNAAQFGDQSGVLTGTRYGEILFYAKDGEGFSKKLASDEQGQALRHPQINAIGVVFAGAKGDHQGLLLGGEGPVYFYAYTGGKNAHGAPEFKAPVVALQSDAELTAGTLPTPVAVDWDGDGVLDMLTGSSEGVVRFFKNIGTNAEPKFLDAVLVEAAGKPIRIEAGYSGSLQGATEARWGYITPTVIDWDGDGLPDLIIGDIRGEYNLYLNRGTKTAPKLQAPVPLFCDGLNLKGRWRCGAAAAKINGRNALAMVDQEDYLHLYWQIDNQNLEDGGRIRMKDGGFITCGNSPVGNSGRTKLFFYDWDGDGHMDILIGTGRTAAIPNRQTGYPVPTLGERTLSTILLVRNAGQKDAFVFEHPVPFIHEKLGPLQPGGSHEMGVSASLLGSADGKPSLLVCGENGRIFLIPNRELTAHAVPPVKQPDRRKK